MEGSVKKFRLGNLVVNLATSPAGEALGRCIKIRSLWPCHIPSQCHYIVSFGCGITEIPCKMRTWVGECWGISKPCYGSDLPDWHDYTPIIQEFTPQITELEPLAVLKADLQAALEAVDKREVVLTAEAKPRTIAEAEQIEAGLKEALKEIQAMKAKMQK
jgi:hypothetical protein